LISPAQLGKVSKIVRQMDRRHNRPDQYHSGQDC
jgi:hypothetical protein